jgi:site-specific recombinase XerD
MVINVLFFLQKKKEEEMTTPSSVFDNYCSTYRVDYTPITDQHFLFPLEDPIRHNTALMEKIFFPSAGAFYLYRPSKRRRALNRAVDRLKASYLPGYEYVIAHLYDKYRRNLTISTISQTAQTLSGFLTFLQELGRNGVEEISRQDIAAYVESEQERGLKINSVRNHLQTVYAFIQYLVDNNILPFEILHRKIRVKLPEVLPRAIAKEDMQKILAGIETVRDRALILLLLHTGMRIGELLQVKMSDIILPERKILLFIGEKNLHGRTVYYSHEAERALKGWLAIRDQGSEYLFYGYRGHELSYVGAWIIMKKAVRKAGLEHKGYSLHSLRHTFATNMLNAGLRLEVLQKLLGHQVIDITLRYAKISDVTREESYFQAMAVIEKGEHHEYDRVNLELQAVFEEKELLGADS